MADAVANQNPDLGKMIARTGECMRRLVEAGVTYEDLQKPIDSPLFRRRLMRLWHEGMTKLPGASFDEARRLCNGNFVTASVANDRFGFHISTDEFSKSHAPLPFNVEELKEKGRDHILVWDPGFSVFQMMGMVPKFFNAERIEKGPYLEERETPGWRLVRRGAVPFTANKVWNSQTERLNEEERVPNIRSLIYAEVARSLSYNDPNLFVRYDLRTDTLGSNKAPLVACCDISRGHAEPRIAIVNISGNSMHKVGLASETIPESILFD